MEQKGIVLKLKQNTVIVLTKEVDFVEVKKKGNVYEGMEMIFSSSDIVKPKSSYTKYAIAAALIICLWVTTLFFTSPIFAEPYAYVSIDINPSFELGVNKDKTIIAAKGLNDESKEMLKEMNLINLKIEKGIQEIIEKSYNKGYLKTDQEEYILIAVSGNEGDREEKEFLDELTSDIIKSSDDITKQKKNQVEIEIVKTDNSKKRIAESKKMSVGKYLLWEKIKSKNPNFNIDEFKKENLKTSIKRLKSYKQEIRSSSDEKKQDLSELHKEQNSNHGEKDDENNNKQKPKTQPSNQLLDKSNNMKGKKRDEKNNLKKEKDTEKIREKYGTTKNEKLEPKKEDKLKGKPGQDKRNVTRENAEEEFIQRRHDLEGENLTTNNTEPEDNSEGYKEDDEENETEEETEEDKIESEHDKKGQEDDNDEYGELKDR